MTIPPRNQAPSRQSILVVDDDGDHAALVVELVRDAGCDAASATDPFTALRLAEQAAFDLLIVDLRMPGMDGLELVERVRARDPNVAILAVTAFGSFETGLRALHAGASGYLPKPFMPADLREQMTRLLETRARVLENEKLRRGVEALLARTRKP